LTSAASTKRHKGKATTDAKFLPKFGRRIPPNFRACGTSAHLYWTVKTGMVHVWVAGKTL